MRGGGDTHRKGHLLMDGLHGLDNVLPLPEGAEGAGAQRLVVAAAVEAHHPEARRLQLWEQDVA